MSSYCADLDTMAKGIALQTRRRFYFWKSSINLENQPYKKTIGPPNKVVDATLL